METSTDRPSKPSSNRSDIVSKFATVCKLRSVGVFATENPLNPCNNDNRFDEDSNDDAEEIECDSGKIHPLPVSLSEKRFAPRERNTCDDEVILKLFDEVSAVKLGYVQLQAAHIPYDPDKIIVADKIVASHLEMLCKIKQAYKEKRFKRAQFDASRMAVIRSNIKVISRMLETLKTQNKAKDSVIIALRQVLHDTVLQNVRLTEMNRRDTLQTKKVKVVDITFFQDAFKAVSKSIHDFAKPLIGLMKASGWDLDEAAYSIESGVVYSKRPDKKYAFEAYIARRMFHEMLRESYDVDDILSFDDPIDALTESPGSDFAKFCRKKYLLLIHPTMERTFFGNLDQRMFVLNGKHPRTPFYQIFSKMAKWVWVLKGIASTIDPEVKIFSVSRGSQFSDAYMESVEDIGGLAIGEQITRQKVEFMVMPGYRIQGIVVKSRVYLSNMT